MILVLVRIRNTCAALRRFRMVPGGCGNIVREALDAIEFKKGRAEVGISCSAHLWASRHAGLAKLLKSGDFDLPILAALRFVLGTALRPSLTARIA